jgi:neutral ceramidase
MPVPVQVLRLGSLALVGGPGEMFAGLGRQIRDQAAAPNSLIAGYANDYAGYLSTPAAFVEGGYETSLGPWCRIAPGGGRMVVDAALELIHGLWCGAD